MKKSIDECPAGPEMDAAVARALELNVLGIALCIPDPECSGYLIRFTGKGDVPRPVYLTDCVCDFREPDDVDYFGHHAGCLDVVHEYSINIAAAWELVEQIVEECLAESQPPVSVQIDTWGNCFVGWVDQGGLTFWSRADTAPLAICRAFLKAKGVTEIEDMTNDAEK